mmetsp:Transcript_28356/g.84904  ORF Transcript_28356/g.84904 Transcript_28356/m.84904 type:complete len:681 (+) Transcript_28356:240-2282(+)
MLTYYSDGSVDGVVRLADDLLFIEPLHRYADHSAKWRGQGSAAGAPGGLGNAVAYLGSRVSNTSMPEHLRGKLAPGVGHVCGADTHAAMLDRQREIAADRVNAGLAPDGGPAAQQPMPPPNATQARNRRGGSRSHLIADCRAAVPRSKCNCPMILVADQTFFNGPYGTGNEAVTAQYMVNTLGAIDLIYRGTEFGAENGIGLSLQDVQVYTSALDSPVPDESYTAQQFLEAFGQNMLTIDPAMRTACLGHVFTHREFAGGVLGLAWVGGEGAGGMCDQGGLNTGFTTSMNFGSTVPVSVLTVTTAHEVGHNWGSPHDPTTAECSPGGNAGNFIMFPQATDGSRPNNELFSPCSRTFMRNVLDRKRNSCFSETASFCGNGYVEGDEECDCGDDCAGSSCCTEDCTIPPTAQCSPQDPISSPCCTESCEFVNASVQRLCRAESECLLESYCGGTSAACPEPEPKPSDTVCGCTDEDCDMYPETGSKVCMDGVCNASICVAYGAEQCDLPEMELACQIACQGAGWGNGSECISTFDDRKPEELNRSLSLGAGFPCADFQGYCDRSNYCQIVESEDALKELEDLLKNVNREAILGWIRSNPALFGGIVGGTVIIAIALYVTRRRIKPFNPEYEPLLDGPREPEAAATRGATAGASASSGPKPKKKGIQRNNRKGTIFENANTKF